MNPDRCERLNRHDATTRRSPAHASRTAGVGEGAAVAVLERSASRRPGIAAGCRFLLITAVPLFITACSDPPPVPIPIDRQVQAETAAGRLVITVPGRLDNRVPVSHAPELSWIPIGWVSDEGARVRPDEPLIRFDTAVLRTWMEGQQRELAEAEAHLRRLALEQEKNLSELAAADLSLEAEHAAAEARLAADRRDEPAARRFAEERARLAEGERERLAGRLRAAEALASRGRLLPRDLADARARAWSANADALAAKREADSFTSGRRAADRSRLELTLDRVSRAITAGGGAAERLANARRLAEADRDSNREWAMKLADELGKRTRFLEQPQIFAKAAGLVRLKDEFVRRGNKLPAAPMVFVLEDDQLVANVWLPGHLRDLVALWTPERPDHGLATVTVGALDAVRSWSARVLAVAAAPEDSPGGRRYKVTLRLDEHQDLSQLKPGMEISAELELPIKAASLPTWAVHLDGDERAPLVRPADGAPRRISGVAAGERFLIFDGLAVGDRVMALTDAGGAERPPPRLTGVVDAADSQRLSLISGNWEVVDVVPDGALVEAGAVVAKLWKTAYWMDTEGMPREHRARWARAQAQRRAAMLRADQDLLNAAKRWWDARSQYLDRRLEQLVNGADARESQLANAEVERATAQAEAARLEADAAALDDRAAADAFSRQDRARRQLAARAARARADRADLALAAARHDPPALQRWSDDARRLDTEREAIDAEGEWQQAAIRHARTVDKANQQFQWERSEIVNQGRELVDRELRAPAAGRVFHKAGLGLKPGVPLWDREPLRLVPESPGRSAARRLEIELPAHLAGRWHQGQRTTVHVPGVGSYPATVVAIGRRYGLSKAAQQEADAGGATLADDQVCDLVLDFQVPAEQVALVLPGVPAYVE